MTTISQRRSGFSTTPVRGSATFNADLQTRMNEMDTDATQTNTMADQMNVVAGEVNGKAEAAAQSVIDAAERVGLAAGQVGLAAEQVALATTQAGNSADSATQAQDYLNDILTAQVFKATSASSVEIGLNEKAFTLVEPNRGYTIGHNVRISDVSAPADNYMTGIVKSYMGDILTVIVSVSGGTGTKNNWSIGLVAGGDAETLNGALVNDEGSSASDLWTAEKILLSISNFWTVDEILSSAMSLSRFARTSNTILAKTDRGKLMEVTSGTWTQTFTAAETLTDGWYCYIKNTGTGIITLDPTETIDGVASFKMYSGEMRAILCDGSVFYSYVLTPFAIEFLTSGTFYKPPGYSKFGWCLAGGGGGGGGGGAGSNTGGGGGGGGGGKNEGVVDATDLGASEAVTIGAGGVSDTIGGTSTFAGKFGFSGGAGGRSNYAGENYSAGSGGGGGTYSGGGSGAASGGGAAGGGGGASGGGGGYFNSAPGGGAGTGGAGGAGGQGQIGNRAAAPPNSSIGGAGSGADSTSPWEVTGGTGGSGKADIWGVA